MYITFVLLLLLVISVQSYILSKKKRDETYPSVKDPPSTIPIQTQTTITVVFSKDPEEEGVIEEIADMYISNRRFFYSDTGKDLQASSKEKSVIVKARQVSWDLLQKIDT